MVRIKSGNVGQVSAKGDHFVRRVPRHKPTLCSRLCSYPTVQTGSVESLLLDSSAHLLTLTGLREAKMEGEAAVEHSGFQSGKKQVWTGCPGSKQEHELAVLPGEPQEAKNEKNKKSAFQHTPLSTKW